MHQHQKCQSLYLKLKKLLKEMLGKHYVIKQCFWYLAIKSSLHSKEYHCLIDND